MSQEKCGSFELFVTRSVSSYVCSVVSLWRSIICLPRVWSYFRSTEGMNSGLFYSVREPKNYYVPYELPNSMCPAPLACLIVLFVTRSVSNYVCSVLSLWQFICLPCVWSYFRSAEVEEERVLDLEELTSLGRRLAACPYYGTRKVWSRIRVSGSI